MMKDQIFRKVSIERLSSPEQLDEMMQVTSAKGWIALLATGFLLFTATIWSLLGSIPTKAAGFCMLMRPGGTFEVVAPTSGRVVDISVEPGDVIREGQIIARIDRTELTGQIHTAESKLNELLSHQNKLQRIRSESEMEQLRFFNNMRANLQERILTIQDRIEFLAGKVQSQEALLSQGLITRQTLLNTQMELTVARQEIKERQNEITRLEMQKIESRKQIESESGNLAIQINEAKRTLANQLRYVDNNTNITSPYTGRVLEIRSAEGEMTGVGMPILTIEQSGASVDDLEVMIYLAPEEGKKVKSNMVVNVAPSTVKKEEFGTMLGRVRTVSEFPSTTQGMMRVLKNEQLVRQLSAQTASISVLASLVPSAGTVSGYKWSSPKGPATKIESGTLCQATITLQTERPISLVIPAIRRLLDI